MTRKKTRKTITRRLLPRRQKWMNNFLVGYYERRQGELMKLTKKELIKKIIGERQEADEKLVTENTKLKAQLEFARSLLPKPREVPDWEDEDD